MFRGGGDLTPRYNLGEVKNKNGKVQPIRGVSLELVAADAARGGGGIASEGDRTGIASGSGLSAIAEVGVSGWPIGGRTLEARGDDGASGGAPA